MEAYRRLDIRWRCPVGLLIEDIVVVTPVPLMDMPVRRSSSEAVHDLIQQTSAMTDLARGLVGYAWLTACAGSQADSVRLSGPMS